MEIEELKKKIAVMNARLPKKKYTLSEWRDELCLDIKDICAIIGISPEYLRQVRRGINPVSKKISDGIYKLTEGKVATKSEIMG